MELYGSLLRSTDETRGPKSSRAYLSAELLKRFLSIFKDRIFDSKVDRGIPSFAAAPEGPNTRPRLSRSAASITRFACARFALSSLSSFGSIGIESSGSQLSLTERTSDSQRITERSITFCNSRMFPGQAYASSSRGGTAYVQGGYVASSPLEKQVRGAIAAK